MNQNINQKISFTFHHGVLTTALKQGYWLILDNIDLAKPEVIERLNSLGEDEPKFHFSEFGTSDRLESLIPHKNFRIICTSNPYRQGTHKISPAFYNRCLKINFISLLQNTSSQSSSLQISDLVKIITRYNENQQLIQTQNYYLAQTLIENHIIMQDYLKSTQNEDCISGFSFTMRQLQMAYELIASDCDWSNTMNLFYGSVYNKCNSENKLKNFSKKYFELNKINRIIQQQTNTFKDQDNKEICKKLVQNFTLLHEYLLNQFQSQIPLINLLVQYIGNSIRILKQIQKIDGISLELNGEWRLKFLGYDIMIFKAKNIDIFLSTPIFINLQGSLSLLNVLFLYSIEIIQGNGAQSFKINCQCQQPDVSIIHFKQLFSEMKAQNLLEYLNIGFGKCHIDIEIFQQYPQLTISFEQQSQPIEFLSFFSISDLNVQAAVGQKFEFNFESKINFCEQLLTELTYNSNQGFKCSPIKNFNLNRFLQQNLRIQINIFPIISTGFCEIDVIQKKLNLKMQLDSIKLFDIFEIRKMTVDLNIDNQNRQDSMLFFFCELYLGDINLCPLEISLNVFKITQTFQMNLSTKKIKSECKNILKPLLTYIIGEYEIIQNYANNIVVQIQDLYIQLKDTKIWNYNSVLSFDWEIPVFKDFFQLKFKQIEIDLDFDKELLSMSGKFSMVVEIFQNQIKFESNYSNDKGLAWEIKFDSDKIKLDFISMCEQIQLIQPYVKYLKQLKDYKQTVNSIKQACIKFHKQITNVEFNIEFNLCQNWKPFGEKILNIVSCILQLEKKPQSPFMIKFEMQIQLFEYNLPPAIIQLPLKNGKYFSIEIFKTKLTELQKFDPIDFAYKALQINEKSTFNLPKISIIDQFEWNLENHDFNSQFTCNEEWKPLQAFNINFLSINNIQFKLQRKSQKWNANLCSNIKLGRFQIEFEAEFSQDKYKYLIFETKNPIQNVKVIEVFHALSDYLKIGYITFLDTLVFDNMKVILEISKISSFKFKFQITLNGGSWTPFKQLPIQLINIHAQILYQYDSQKNKEVSNWDGSYIMGLLKIGNINLLSKICRIQQNGTWIIKNNEQDEQKIEYKLNEIIKNIIGLEVPYLSIQLNKYNFLIEVNEQTTKIEAQFYIKQYTILQEPIKLELSDVELDLKISNKHQGWERLNGSSLNFTISFFGWQINSQIKFPLTDLLVIEGRFDGKLYINDIIQKFGGVVGIQHKGFDIFKSIVFDSIDIKAELNISKNISLQSLKFQFYSQKFAIYQNLIYLHNIYFSFTYSEKKWDFFLRGELNFYGQNLYVEFNPYNQQFNLIGEQQLELESLQSKFTEQEDIFKISKSFYKNSFQINFIKFFYHKEIAHVNVAIKNQMQVHLEFQYTTGQKKFLMYLQTLSNFDLEQISQFLFKILNFVDISINKFQTLAIYSQQNAKVKSEYDIINKCIEEMKIQKQPPFIYMECDLNFEGQFWEFFGFQRSIKSQCLIDLKNLKQSTITCDPIQKFYENFEFKSIISLKNQEINIAINFKINEIILQGSTIYSKDRIAIEFDVKNWQKPFGINCIEVQDLKFQFSVQKNFLNLYKNKQLAIKKLSNLISLTFSGTIKFFDTTVSAYGNFSLIGTLLSQDTIAFSIQNLNFQQLLAAVGIDQDLKLLPIIKQLIFIKTFSTIQIQDFNKNIIDQMKNLSLIQDQEQIGPGITIGGSFIYNKVECEFFGQLDILKGIQAYGKLSYDSKILKISGINNKYAQFKLILNKDVQILEADINIILFDQKLTSQLKMNKFKLNTQFNLELCRYVFNSKISFSQNKGILLATINSETHNECQNLLDQAKEEIQNDKYKKYDDQQKNYFLSVFSSCFTIQELQFEIVLDKNDLYCKFKYSIRIIVKQMKGEINLKFDISPIKSFLDYIFSLIKKQKMIEQTLEKISQGQTNFNQTYGNEVIEKQDEKEEKKKDQNDEKKQQQEEQDQQVKKQQENEENKKQQNLDKKKQNKKNEDHEKNNLNSLNDEKDDNNDESQVKQRDNIKEKQKKIIRQNHLNANDKEINQDLYQNIDDQQKIIQDKQKNDKQKIFQEFNIPEQNKLEQINKQKDQEQSQLNMKGNIQDYCEDLNKFDQQKKGKNQDKYQELQQFNQNQDYKQRKKIIRNVHNDDDEKNQSLQNKDLVQNDNPVDDQQDKPSQKHEDAQQDNKEIKQQYMGENIFQQNQLEQDNKFPLKRKIIQNVHNDDDEKNQSLQNKDLVQNDNPVNEKQIILKNDPSKEKSSKFDLVIEKKYLQINTTDYSEFYLNSSQIRLMNTSRIKLLKSINLKHSKDSGKDQCKPLQFNEKLENQIQQSEKQSIPQGEIFINYKFFNLQCSIIWKAFIKDSKKQVKQNKGRILIQSDFLKQDILFINTFVETLLILNFFKQQLEIILTGNHEPIILKQLNQYIDEKKLSEILNGACSLKTNQQTIQKIDRLDFVILFTKLKLLEFHQDCISQFTQIGIQSILLCQMQQDGKFKYLIKNLINNKYREMNFFDLIAQALQIQNDQFQIVQQINKQQKNELNIFEIYQQKQQSQELVLQPKANLKFDGNQAQVQRIELPPNLIQKIDISQIDESNRFVNLIQKQLENNITNGINEFQQISPNVYTRYSTSIKGKTIDIKGIIKFISSNGTAKDIWRCKNKGGKHLMNLSIVINVSSHSRQYIQQLMIPLLLSLIKILQIQKINTYCVIYNQQIYIVKSSSTHDWTEDENGRLFSAMNSTMNQDDNPIIDLMAVQCGLDLLKQDHNSKKSLLFIQNGLINYPICDIQTLYTNCKNASVQFVTLSIGSYAYINKEINLPHDISFLHLSQLNDLVQLLFGEIDIHFEKFVPYNQQTNIIWQTKNEQKLVKKSNNIQNQISQQYLNQYCQFNDQEQNNNDNLNQIQAQDQGFETSDEFKKMNQLQQQAFIRQQNRLLEYYNVRQKIMNLK